MADKKISQLTAVSGATDGHEFAVNEAGVSKKITMAQIKTGPFRVRRSADATDYIEIDPDNAKISAANDSRPLRRLSLPALRNYGTVTASAIGQLIPAVSVTLANLGGMYTLPLRIPTDMDLTAALNVYLIIAPTANATTNGQVVRFQLSEVHVSDGQARSENSFNYDWSVPDNWTTDQTKIVLLDNGSGFSIAGGTFSVNQVIAFRFARVGSAAEDTFDKTVAMAEGIILEYTANQF